MRALGSVGIGLMVLVLAGAASADPGDLADPAGNPDGRPLLDLHYGDVLYHEFQQDEFGALTRLMAARQLGRAQAHAEDSELLRGGMLLSLGQVDDALAVFQKLLQTETRAPERNRAWLAMGRALYRRGELAPALDALDHIDARLPGDLEADRQTLSAEILIDLGRFEEAAKRLQAWNGVRDWVSFVQFNLGVAMIRGGREADGEAQLDAVDRDGLGGAEQLALRDRANTALGFARLQAQRWDDARTALRRVRLKGPSSNQALLGLGWAESAQNRDRDALVPWMELAGRDASDQAVQEALLAVPYAMARAGSITAAAQRYQNAIDLYDQQLHQVDGLVAAVNRPEFLDALLAPDAHDSAAPDFNPDKPVAPAAHLPAGPEYQALSRLIASEAFQAGLSGCRDIAVVTRNLANWRQRIDDPSSPDHAALAGQAARVESVSAAAAQVLQRQRRELQDMAITELQHRKQRLLDYKAEAGFGAARLYDQSSMRRPAPAKPAGTPP